MSALTSSIGHELGQPLGSMIHNAQALQMMVTANRATPDTIGEILSDIQTQGVRATQIIDRHRTMLRSRQLDKKPIDLHAVINETLALVAHDMQARQIEATVDLSVESVRHQRRSGAPAAGAREPRDERHGRDGRDAAGPAPRHDQQRCQGRRRRGLRARQRDRACRPRSSARCSPRSSRRKSHGLGIGLTIVRTIVDAHGGTIVARNNPEGGATFTVTLRRSEAPGLEPGLSGAA